jgi:hypothetical protein
MSPDRVIKNSAHKLAQHVLKKYRHAMICAVVEKIKFIAELTLQTSATAVGSAAHFATGRMYSLCCRPLAYNDRT